jgi:hypothetical protein
MSYIEEYVANGMRPIQEWQLTEYQQMDAAIARAMTCPKCGERMGYEGWRGSGYQALAVCSKCNVEVEI